MPFIFNGLKISTTLALIKIEVAEFFGSPTVGMGFRISTSVGRLALDMVWAEIVVAAVVGSLFYGVIVIIEKGVTFLAPHKEAKEQNIFKMEINMKIIKRYFCCYYGLCSKCC